MPPSPPGVGGDAGSGAFYTSAAPPKPTRTRIRIQWGPATIHCQGVLRVRFAATGSGRVDGERVVLVDYSLRGTAHVDVTTAMEMRTRVADGFGSEELELLLMAAALLDQESV